MLRTEPAYLGRAKSFMAGGFALLAFVFALAAGTAGAPALGGLSWVMVTAGAAGVVYVDRLDAGEYPVGPDGQIVQGLAAGEAALPRRPARPLLPDVGGGEAVVGAVVPLHQIGLEFGLVAVAGQPGGLQRPFQRADQDESEPFPGQPGTEPLGLAAPPVGEGDVGPAGVLAGGGPLPLAVAGGGNPRGG